MKKSVTTIERRKRIIYTQELCHVCKKEFKTILIEYCNIKDHGHYTGKHRGAPYNIYNLIPKEIPIAFYNGLKYDYHFTAIILSFKGLADEFNE